MHEAPVGSFGLPAIAVRDREMIELRISRRGVLAAYLTEPLVSTSDLILLLIAEGSARIESDSDITRDIRSPPFVIRLKR